MEYTLENNEEYSVTDWLPNNGEKVMAFGYKTVCCQCDMETERKWHEVVFSFDVPSYKLKKQIPEGLEESILEMCNCRERWEVEGEEPPDHLIGVTKWKRLK